MKTTENIAGFVSPLIGMVILGISFTAFSTALIGSIHMRQTAQQKSVATDIAHRTLENFLNLGWDDSILMEGIHPEGAALPGIEWKVKTLSPRLKQITIRSKVSSVRRFSSSSISVMGFKYDDF